MERLEYGQKRDASGRAPRPHADLHQGPNSWEGFKSASVSDSRPQVHPWLTWTHRKRVYQINLFSTRVTPARARRGELAVAVSRHVVSLPGIICARCSWSRSSGSRAGRSLLGGTYRSTLDVPLAPSWHRCWACGPPIIALRDRMLSPSTTLFAGRSSADPAAVDLLCPRPPPGGAALIAAGISLAGAGAALYGACTISRREPPKSSSSSSLAHPGRAVAQGLHQFGPNQSAA